jgi:2-polyprenyl-3-methyl-5-hydroxy-6-metoxy-1,4-benzoquinol methylase
MESCPWHNISDWLVWWLNEPRLTPANQEVLDHYYHSYKSGFPQYISAYYTKQTEQVMQLMSLHECLRILEVGCGCGTESLWFAQQGASVVGIDLSEPRLSVARERAHYLQDKLSCALDVQFQNTSLFTLQQRAEFDLIWMEQAFHHIEPRSEVPDVLHRLLRPGGYVVIAEANGWNPLLQLQLLRQRGLRTIGEYIDAAGKVHLYGVERITTASRIARLFRKHGFELVEVKRFRVLPNFKSVDRFSWIDAWVPAWLVPAFTHFNIVLRKA